MNIAKLQKEELPEALALILTVFMQYEAPEYLPEGVEMFRRIVDYNAIAPELDSGKLVFWRCDHEGRIVGVAAVRDGTHISLLFVDSAFHRQGIARRLFAAACRGRDAMTVNSSPYAVNAYRKLGFAATDTEQLKDGIRFTPMRWQASSG